MPRLRATGLTLVLAGAAIFAPAAFAEPKVLESGGVPFALEWNPTWQVGKPDGEIPPDAAVFNTANQHDMFVVVLATTKPAETDADQKLRAIIESAASQFGPQSVEKDVKIEPFGSNGTRGYRMCITDSAPKPDEYKYMCEGAASNGTLVVQFTVLYNDAGKADAMDAVKAFESVREAKDSARP